MTRYVLPLLMLIQAVIGLSNPAIAADELKTLPNCTLDETDWSDGDSFPVADATGNQLTVRLYGVDCLELHVADDSDARRLRGQRRYFGISHLGGNPQASIEATKKFGLDAKTFVKQQLGQPFSVHTSYADARGDGRYIRVYAFVTCSDGEDLGVKLVRVGLARAFGVYRETPDGRSQEEYRQWLRDQELWAAKRGVGIWSATDWDSLPNERQQDRAEAAELEMAKSRSASEIDGFQLNPNTAARDELMRLPGIGEALANRIIEARPLASVESLLEVPGIGKKTLEKLRPFLKLE